MAGPPRYPGTREEVALKLLEKIRMAERKSPVAGAGPGMKAAYREEALALLARCIAAVDGRHGKDAPAAETPAEAAPEGSSVMAAKPIPVGGEPV